MVKGEGSDIGWEGARGRGKGREVHRLGTRMHSELQKRRQSEGEREGEGRRRWQRKKGR